MPAATQSAVAAKSAMPAATAKRPAVAVPARHANEPLQRLTAAPEGGASAGARPTAATGSCGGAAPAHHPPRAPPSIHAQAHVSDPSAARQGVQQVPGARGGAPAQRGGGGASEAGHAGKVQGTRHVAPAPASSGGTPHLPPLQLPGAKQLLAAEKSAGKDRIARPQALSGHSGPAADSAAAPGPVPPSPLGTRPEVPRPQQPATRSAPVMADRAAVAGMQGRVRQGDEAQAAPGKHVRPEKDGILRQKSGTMRASGGPAAGPRAPGAARGEQPARPGGPKLAKQPAPPGRSAQSGVQGPGPKSLVPDAEPPSPVARPLPRQLSGGGSRAGGKTAAGEGAPPRPPAPASAGAAKQQASAAAPQAVADKPGATKGPMARPLAQPRQQMPAGGGGDLARTPSSPARWRLLLPATATHAAAAGRFLAASGQHRVLMLVNFV